ncbi:MAG: phenylalanine--tRNA ligase subunit beta [Saprospiraceae bacterium]
MKVSLNWLRDFLDIDKSPQQIEEILTSLGLEVEGWEEAKASPVDLDKVFTAQVIECERIPDTDHLSATKVDAGDGLVRSVVCGAPNVAAGQKVLLAVPGANVFSKDGQLFQIGERKVKGIPSQGMICAEDELGIGHDHSGIMVLPPDTPIGISAAQFLGKTSDIVFEIGLTPNRADATNHLGVARDLAAWLRANEAGNWKLEIRNSEIEKFPIPNSQFPVSVEDESACPRFTGVLLKNLKVAESPDWLKNRLLAIGQRPINNVVDVTNYVRAELGQPLHAYDFREVAGGKIIVRTLPEGTVFKTLDEVERKLFAEDLMVCDGNGTPMCMGGVFGGATSGVKDSTTDIFLEAAFFSPKSIRRSMIRHGLRTDAAWMFEKGVDPNGCRRALERAAALILELAGGEVASQVVDIYPNPVQPARVAMRFERIHQLIGQDLTKERVRQILAALEIGMADETADGFTAIIPTNKPDVLREADVVEEILRVHGLDTVPTPTQFRASVEVTPRPNPDAIRNLAADILSAAGFNECMSLSLSQGGYYRGDDALLPMPEASLVSVYNTANQGLDTLRPTMLFSGLEAVRHNQNRQNADLRLYEFGKTYQRLTVDGGRQTVGGFQETYRLAIFLTGAHSPESWQPAAKTAVDFFTLKSHVQNLLARLGVSGFQETAVGSEQNPAFQFALKYHRGPEELVTFGKVSPAILKKMDIKQAVFFADFNWENVLKALKNNKVQYREVSRFPSVRRDLALVLDRSKSFADVRATATKTVKKLLTEVNLFDVFEDETKLGAGKKSYAVSFTFEDPEKTLQEKEIDAAMTQLQTAFEQKLGAAIRK